MRSLYAVRVIFGLSIATFALALSPNIGYSCTGKSVQIFIYDLKIPTIYA